MSLKLHHLFLSLALAPIFVASALSAADEAPLLNKTGKIISQPDFKQPLGAEWSVAKGKWVPENGVLTATDLPEEHHAAVLHLATGPASLIVECEFRLDTARIFYVGCDASKHVGRLIVTPKNARLAEDSTEVKGKSPSHVLAEAKLDLKPGDWQKLRVEFTGDRMAARLNGIDLQAQHAYLATPKKRWWFAVGGGTAELRNVRVSEGEPVK